MPDPLTAAQSWTLAVLAVGAVMAVVQAVTDGRRWWAVVAVLCSFGAGFLLGMAQGDVIIENYICDAAVKEIVCAETVRLGEWETP